MPNVTYTVTGRGVDAARTEIQAGNHQLIVDEPKKLGGGDAGPNPLEYLLAALTGCLNVTGWKVAGELGFTVRGISFEVSGTLDPSKFMGRDTDQRAGYHTIEVHATLDCDADDETLEQWARAVEARCPVSDNLGGEATNLHVMPKR